MLEFDSVSVSSFEAATLAAKLTERSADGWEVVAIVPAGSEVTAFLSREATASAPADETADIAATTVIASDPTPEPTAAEPAGWGEAPAAAAATAAAGDAGWGTSSSTTPTDTAVGWGTEPASPVAASAAATQPSQAPAAAPQPTVPPGWYADPSGRYELRYWDGSGWTEHVARAGQQYTDPPVA